MMLNPKLLLKTVDNHYLSANSYTAYCLSFLAFIVRITVYIGSLKRQLQEINNVAKMEQRSHSDRKSI